MNKLAMAITPVFAFGIVMTASATSISIKTDTHKSASPELLMIAQSNQSEVPEVVEGAFKQQDPDSIIRSTAEPDVDAVKPEPGAEPKPFKNKAHTGMDSTPKRVE